MTRKEQAEITKQKITTSALKLASAKSISDIKISDICEAASVSTGSFYHYFKTKEDVFLLANDAFDAWLRRRVSRYASMTNREKIEALVHDFLKNAKLSSWQGIRTTYSLMLSREEAPIKKELFIKLIESFLSEGEATGEFKLACSLDDAVSLITVLLRGYAFDWAYVDGKFDIIDTGNRIINIILSKILE